MYSHLSQILQLDNLKLSFIINFIVCNLKECSSSAYAVTNSSLTASANSCLHKIMSYLCWTIYLPYTMCVYNKTSVQISWCIFYWAVFPYPGYVWTLWVSTISLVDLVSHIVINIVFLLCLWLCVSVSVCVPVSDASSLARTKLVICNTSIGECDFKRS